MNSPLATARAPSSGSSWWLSAHPGRGVARAFRASVHSTRHRTPQGPSSPDPGRHSVCRTRSHAGSDAGPDRWSRPQSRSPSRRRRMQPTPDPSSEPSSPDAVRPRIRRPNPHRAPPRRPRLGSRSSTAGWTCRCLRQGRRGRRRWTPAATGAERFVVYHVRFQVVNTGTTDLHLSPRLETGGGADPGTWQLVPEEDPEGGIAFYAASDAGRVFRARSSAIEPAEAATRHGSASGYVPTAGVISAGLNPAPNVSLPGLSFTEVEFAVRATVDAKWTRTYAFRLQPGAETVVGGAPATVTMGPKPPIVLTVPDPKSITTGETITYQLAVAVVGPDTGPAYPLRLGQSRLAAHRQQHHLRWMCRLPRRTRVHDQPAPVPCLPDRPASFTRRTVRRCRLRPVPDLPRGVALRRRERQRQPAHHLPGHGYHLGHIPDKGTGGVDITVPGDGQGNSLCAECHYNLHGNPTPSAAS